MDSGIGISMIKGWLPCLSSHKTNQEKVKSIPANSKKANMVPEMENESEQKEVVEVARGPVPKRRVPSRSLFVAPFLAFHTLITLFFLPAFGSSPSAGLFEIYFIFTSFPTNLVGALLPKFLSQSPYFVACLAINSVLVAWCFACGLHFFLYKEQGES